MKEIQWRDSTPESVRQTGTPSAAKENLRLYGVAYTTMTANKHTTLFDGGVVKQVTTPLQVVADDDTQEVQLLNLYPDIRYQTIDGFGGAITEAAGSVLRQMPEETAEKILRGTSITFLPVYHIASHMHVPKHSRKNCDPSHDRSVLSMRPFVHAPHDTHTGQYLPFPVH